MIRSRSRSASQPLVVTNVGLFGGVLDFLSEWWQDVIGSADSGAHSNEEKVMSFLYDSALALYR